MGHSLSGVASKSEQERLLHVMKAVVREAGGRVGKLLLQGLEVGMCEAGLRNGALMSGAIPSVSERGEWLGKQLGLHCQQPQMPSQEAWTPVSGDPQKGRT